MPLEADRIVAVVNDEVLTFLRRADLPAAVAALGEVIVWLPERMAPALERLVRSVVELAPAGVKT